VSGFVRNHNNFDFIRFILASFIILPHSVLLTGNELNTFFVLTKGQLEPGAFLVYLFFVVSGYLVVASYLRLNNTIKYLLFRALRIFPALIVAVFLTVFVIGPIVTTVSMHQYFTSENTYLYLNNIWLHMNYHLTGFDSHSPTIYNTLVNGSIWTLPIEFTCYLMIAVLGALRLLNKYTVLLVGVIGISCSINFSILFHPAPNIFFHPWLWGIARHLFFPLEEFFQIMPYFFFGAYFNLNQENIVYNYKRSVIALIIIAITIITGHGLNTVLPITGTYLLLHLAFNKRIKFQNFGKYGDFSYGIYLYGFLIQQLVIMYFNGKISYTLNYLMSFLIALVMGIVSYHYIEKPCMSLKRLVNKSKKIDTHSETSALPFSY